MGLHCEKFWIPPKFVMGPEEPPETLSADQSQEPVHDPEPQFTATRIASLFTVKLFVLPTKFTPWAPPRDMSVPGTAGPGALHDM